MGIVDRVRAYAGAEDAGSSTYRLFPDAARSIAYARALARAGVITEEEAGTLQNGLEKIRTEFSEERFELKPGDEDIHNEMFGIFGT